MSENVPTKDQARNLCWAMHRLSRCCSRREAATVACADLTVSECQSLYWLAEHPEGSLEQMAATLEVSRGRLTRILDRLEAKELVVRTPDPNDRRALRVRLTDLGQKRLESAEGQRLAEARNILECFSEEERNEVLRTLSRLEEVLGSRSQ